MPEAPIRTEFIEFDARKDAKTNRYCVKCQKDIFPNETCRRVYVTEDMHAVHPEDLSRYVQKKSDIGWQLVGNKCAKHLGLEWSIAELRNDPVCT